MVRPCTGSRIALRIQVNIETSVPICGENPLRGPMMFSLSSAAPTTAPAIESDEKPAAPSPQPRTADPFKKLRRLLGCSVQSISASTEGVCGKTLHQVNRDSGHNPLPKKKFRKKLYVI